MFHVEHSPMKELPHIFKRGETNYSLVQRHSNVAIYKLTTGELVSYEVVVLVNEQYPSNQAWGNLGWTYANLDDAKEKASREEYLIATE